MDILDTEQSNQKFISDQLKAYLLETAKWSKFLSIMGFIFCGILFVMAFAVSAIMGSVAALAPTNNMPMDFGSLSGIFTGVYLGIVVFYFIPTLYLFQFSTITIKSIENESLPDLEKGVGKLKSVFKYWGIFTLIILSFYGLSLLIALLGALM
ncbi:MAG: hypothetical protein MUE33_09940 [Cytophagaceae bacterium]|jgi:hypothetical protein|nr:hypothetical protein [Cytophagaceae bacterium]